jgi:hypothetical protein
MCVLVMAMNSCQMSSAQEPDLYSTIGPAQQPPEPMISEFAFWCGAVVVVVMSLAAVYCFVHTVWELEDSPDR